MKRLLELIMLTIVVLLTACEQGPRDTDGPAPVDPPAEEVPTLDGVPIPSNAYEERTTGEMAEKLRVELVSVTPLTSSSEKVRVAYKATNIAERGIVRAKAAIIVLDANGTEIGRETHWIVKSEGSLMPPGASVEEDFIITVTDKQKAASAKFVLETVRGG